MSSYKNLHAFEKRKLEASKIRQKYPDRIPIIVERRDSKDPSIDKVKYLVPANFQLAQFQNLIRERVKIKSDEALFLFINKTLEPAGKNLGLIYKESADEDGFLYITYTKESTFG